MQQRESYSKKRGSLFVDNVTISTHEHGRPLMTAGEILTLPYTDAILFVGGCNGYRARKIMYYIDPRFAPRANLPRPDSPEEQAAELPRPLPASEWRQLAPVAPPSVPAAIAAPQVVPVQSSIAVSDDLADMQQLSALEESAGDAEEVMPW